MEPSASFLQVKEEVLNQYHTRISEDLYSLVLKHWNQQHVNRLRGVAEERETRIEDAALRGWRLGWLFGGRVQHIGIADLVQRDLIKQWKED